MAQNRYYVYAQYTKDTGDLFYIGKGSGDRAFSKKGRSIYWNRVASKHGFTNKILIDNLDEGSAFIQEILAIKELRPRCNFTKGGEGVSGFRQSKETIEKRVKKGTNHYRYGKTIPKELVQKMHSALRELNLPNGRSVPVRCTVTGKNWTTILECAKELGIKATTLRAKIRGQSRNNTSIVRINEKEGAI